ncbi:MAG: hypothetical protein U9N30_09660 [Campylobacterota bacterium]|nr:hypothetical protein [Campylobacterota bacterium]
MLSKNIFDRPVSLIALLIAVFLLNTVSSTYFIQITLAGVVFLGFLKTLDNKYYNSFILIVCMFIVIESNQGLNLFTLTIFSYVSYLTIIPYLDKVFTIASVRDFVQLFWFYIGLGIAYSTLIEFDWAIVGIIMLNLILDIILVGLFL